MLPAAPASGAFCVCPMWARTPALGGGGCEAEELSSQVTVRFWGRGSAAGRSTSRTRHCRQVRRSASGWPAPISERQASGRHSCEHRRGRRRLPGRTSPWRGAAHGHRDHIKRWVQCAHFPKTNLRALILKRRTKRSGVIPDPVFRKTWNPLCPASRPQLGPPYRWLSRQLGEATLAAQGSGDSSPNKTRPDGQRSLGDHTRRCPLLDPGECALPQLPRG